MGTSVRFIGYLAEHYWRHRHMRSFDVAIEGKTVIENHEPRTAGFERIHTREIVTTVEDGVLDIDFLHRVENPSVWGIVIERAD